MLASDNRILDHDESSQGPTLAAFDLSCLPPPKPVFVRSKAVSADSVHKRILPRCQDEASHDEENMLDMAGIVPCSRASHNRCVGRVLLAFEGHGIAAGSRQCALTRIDEFRRLLRDL